jgi:hypothetical protein
MSEIKEVKPQGMMSKQTENEETSFMSRIIPDPEERRAAGQLVRKALTGFSTFIGNTAEQYGGLVEEKEIDERELNAAIKAGEQQIKVVDEENELRAKRLQNITDRGKGFQEEGSLLMSDPMFKLAMKKYTQKTGKTIDLTDPNLKRNLGKRFIKGKKNNNQKTAVATIVNEIYTASEDPEIPLFEKEFKTPLTVKVKKPIDSQMAQLEQPTGVFGSIDARRPSNVARRITQEGSKLKDFVDEPKVTSTSETFPVMDPSGIFRVKREVHSKIASANKLKLSYANERSDKPIFKKGTGNKTNDLAYAKAATELVDFVVDAGYGEEDSDKVFRDVLLIVQNAAPRKDDSQQEQKDLNSKVAQIKSKLALMDNRFEKRRLIEQLKKGEGLPKEEKRVVDNNTIVRTATGATSEDSVGSYLYKTHSSNPNIKQIDDTNYSVTVIKDTGNYPAGTVLNVKVKDGEVLNISDTGQKADVMPSPPATYEEWKALPEETIEQKKAKRRFMNMEVVRKGIQEENKRKRD